MRENLGLGKRTFVLLRPKNLTWGKVILPISPLMSNTSLLLKAPFGTASLCVWVALLPIPTETANICSRPQIWQLYLAIIEFFVRETISTRSESKFPPQEHSHSLPNLCSNSLNILFPITKNYIKVSTYAQVCLGLPPLLTTSLPEVSCALPV